MTNETTPASSLTDKEREAIAQMPYEEARDQLIQAVQALEAGGLNLDQSMRTGHCGQYRWNARQFGLSIPKYRQYSIFMTVRHTFLQGVMCRTVIPKFRISSFRHHTRPECV